MWTARQGECFFKGVPNEKVFVLVLRHLLVGAVFLEIQQCRSTHEHSPFARYFIDVLESYGGKDGYLTFEDIYKSVERSKPGPIGDNFGRWDPGSNFFFVANHKE
ncbi:MAG: hypothetical protein JWM21_4203 [Acidobacteria bacterium]|nr:hypothetical protein [Acidobacteriota bacterium]